MLQTAASDVAPFFQVPQPRERKAAVALWSDLTLADCDALAIVESNEALRQTLSDIFSLDPSDLRAAVLLDLFYHTVRFSRDHEYSREQTSALFSIVKRTHELSVESPYGNVQLSWTYFKELLLTHSVRRPPFSIDLFNTDQVQEIADYVLNTYFRHFKLYKYAFTPLVKLDLNIHYTGEPEPEPSKTQIIDSDADKSGATADNVSESVDEVSASPALEEIVPEGTLSELRQLVDSSLANQLGTLRAELTAELGETERRLAGQLRDLEGVEVTDSKSAKGKKKK